MTHESQNVIIHSIIDPWTQPETHPGVAEHFTAAQIARIVSFQEHPDLSFSDKLFLWRMLGKLLFTAT